MDGEGTLGQTELDITIAGQNSTDLDDNVTMTFNEQYNTSDTAVCVWWNENIQEWMTNGCTTKFNSADGSVTCLCNHLTTFAVIHALNSKGACFIDTEFHIVSLFFIICFLIISAYVIVSIYPFYKNHSMSNICCRHLFLLALLRPIALGLPHLTCDFLLYHELL